MPISSGTVSKGEKTKSKFQTLNLSNVFIQKPQGESSKTNQQKSLNSKHGMSVLGKVPSARRPLNLPSIKSEFSGNDPPINLVPTGGSGWGKSGETGPPPTTQAQQVTVPSTPPITINTSVPPPNIAHGDKSWSAKIAGKPSNPPNYNSTHQSPLFNQEFPSLSGNVDAQYGPGPSLRPQTEGSWIQGGTHHQIGGEVGNQQLTAHVQDHPVETVPPEVEAILPTFMKEPKLSGFTNPPPGPPRLAHRFSQHPPIHDNRFMQRPPPLLGKDHLQCAIVKEEELSKLDEVSKDGGWALHDDIDYNQKLNFSDDEAEESENKENKQSHRSYNEQSSAIHDTSNSSLEDEVKVLNKKKMNEIIEKAKVRKETEELRFIEQRNNAAKKLEALNKKKSEEKKDVESKEKEERKPTVQPVVKDGNEFRQLTQLGNDKPQGYNKEPANNFSSRFSSTNKPPRMRKQEEMQHNKGYYRQNQERNFYERDYERDSRYPEYDSRDRYKGNNMRDNNRDFRGGGFDNRKYSDQRSNYYNKYEGRYSDSSDPSVESRQQRDSWERETKRKDSDRSKTPYDDDSERPRSDNEHREKSKDLNSWESEKSADNYDSNRWADQSDYDQDEGWEKEKRLERPQRPDSRESRTSRDSKTSHSDHVREDMKLNTIDDPEEQVERERERKPMLLHKTTPYTRGSGVPITLEKLEAAESKDKTSSMLVPLGRDKNTDYRKSDGKDEKKKDLDAWSTPLNTSKSTDLKKEGKSESSKEAEVKSEEKQAENVDKEKEDKNVNKDKEEKDFGNKKNENRDRDVHHRDRDNRDRGGRGGRDNRYPSSRSNEWSKSYNSSYNKGWSQRDNRDSHNDRRGHSRGGPSSQSRGGYSRHSGRSESDPESGKEDSRQYYDRDRRTDKAPRKERDDSRYNDRGYERKDRGDRYYDSRNAPREYSRGGGGNSYRSTPRDRGDRRGDSYGSSKNSFSGDEKKPSRDKKDSIEDEKKEKKITKTVNKSKNDKNDKDWESDGKDSMDEDKYKGRSSYNQRNTRGGVRSTYTSRKNEKFGKERSKDDNRDEIQEEEEENDNKKEDHGFQEVKNKKNVKESVTTSSSNVKKTDDKSKTKETSKPTSTKPAVSSQANNNKSANNSSGNKSNASQQKQASQTSSGKNEKVSKNDGSTLSSTAVNTQKKIEDNAAAQNEFKMQYSSVKDVTGPAPPPPTINAWDKPINAALKSSSPVPPPVKPQQQQQSLPSFGGSNDSGSNVSGSIDDSTSSNVAQQQQQQQQKMESYRSSPIHHQQQVFNEQQQHQQLVNQQKQQQQQQQQQIQQSQAQTIDKIDASLLDGTSNTVPTIIFENTNYKPSIEHQFRSKEMLDDYKQQDLGISNKEDNSDMKLDFTYGADLRTEDCKTSMLSHNVQYMTQSSAAELNMKIASVKSVWDETEKQSDVNTFPPHSSTSGSSHFSSAEESYKVSVPAGSGGGSGNVSNVNVDITSNEDMRNSAANDMQMYSNVQARMQQQVQQAAAHAHVNTYTTSMSHNKEQQQQAEIQKISKQQMQAAPVMSTPPPQTFGQTHYQTAQYNTLPSITSPPVIYNTPQLQNQGYAYSLNDASQIISTAPTRQTATQYPLPLNFSQGFSTTINQQPPSMYLHQPTTPSATSDLSSQIQTYRIAPGAGYNSQQLGTNPPLYISNTTSVKQSNPGTIGTKSGYQSTGGNGQVFIPSIYDPSALSYLSQTARQAPSASSFYSTGTTGGSSGQVPNYYQTPAAAYATHQNPVASQYINYNSQSPAPTGQQLPSGMSKGVVSGKYSTPPPQQPAVKYSTYPTQQQMISQSGGGGGGQQTTQVLITQTSQQTNQQ